jgi:hypothetical protein
MLPNPTSDLWLKKIGAKASWKITKLMEIFQTRLKELIDNEGLESDEKGNRITTIATQWRRIADLNCTDEANLSIEVREAIHDAIDETTKYLLSISQLNVLSVLVSHVTKVVDVLDDPMSQLNTIVLANKEDALLSYYFYKIRPVVVENLDGNKKPLSKSEKEERNTIWITLIFRMLCWLLLHDFDKSDVKIVPSDLKGSRMPVYIG